MLSGGPKGVGIVDRAEVLMEVGDEGLSEGGEGFVLTLKEGVGKGVGSCEA